MVLNHVLDGKLFGRNHSELGNQVQTDFVDKISSLVCNFGMNLLQLLFGFASLVGPPLLSCQTASGSSHARQGIFKKPWIVNLLPIGSGQKMIQAHVDSDMGLAIRNERFFSEVASQNHIPVTSFSLNANGLNFASFIPMLPHSNWFFKSMQPKFVALEADAVAVCGKEDRVPAVRTFESRIARKLSCLNPFEEGFKSFVKPPQCGLSRTEVQGFEAGVMGPKGLKPSGLLRVRDSFFVFGPRGAALCEGFVVEGAMGVQELPERQLLGCSWVEAEFKSPQKFKRFEHSHCLSVNIIQGGDGFRKGVLANSSAA